MSEYESVIVDSIEMWVNRTVRLMLRRRDGTRVEYLRSDGLWQSVEEGSAPGVEVGIELPRASIEAIAVAVQEWQGHTSHADTEARVLREALDIERARVDRALAR
jgi:hypothetical protein